MPPSANKSHALVARSLPRTGRSVSARHYSMPKPYRRKRFVEDAARMSRLRMTALTLSGLLIVGLIGALAALIKDNLDSPPVLIVAAPRPTHVVRTAAPKAAPLPPLTLEAPAASAPAPARVWPAAKAARPAQQALNKELIPPDPDVILISAILSLTAAPGQDAAPDCAAGISDSGCAALHGMEP